MTLLPILSVTLAMAASNSVIGSKFNQAMPLFDESGDYSSCRAQFVKRGTAYAGLFPPFQVKQNDCSNASVNPLFTAQTQGGATPLFTDELFSDFPEYIGCSVPFKNHGGRWLTGFFAPREIRLEDCY